MGGEVVVGAVNCNIALWAIYKRGMRVIKLGRIGRWGAIVIGVLGGLYAVGRPLQIYLQSQYQGERAPYLQMLGADRVTIRWQTLDSTLGALSYWPEGQKVESKMVREPEARQEHRLSLYGLLPATRYRYTLLGESHDPAESFWFETAPPVGDDRSVRIWVQGDAGYYRDKAERTTQGFKRWLAAHPRPERPEFDLWISTGDSAYKSGSAAEFQRELFDAYPELLPHYSFWSVYGNHDARRWAFFDIFDFPTGGELGGVPSYTEHYYSLDYGNLHLIFLDSEASALDGDSKMAEWLRLDLQATQQPWVIALFHHPPYTKGGHDSDSSRDSGGRMVDMREQIVPILEQGGVDLVLNGHSHVYERSDLIRCHYGAATTFSPEMVVDGESPYLKSTGPLGGALYLVVGASAKLDDGPLDHPAMDIAIKRRGSLVLDIDPNGIVGRYIDVKGEVVDQFTLQQQDHDSPAIACH